MLINLLALLQAPLPTPANTPRPAHDAIHYAITIEIPDSGRRITGEVDTRWRLLSSDPIRVELDSAFEVVEIRVGRAQVRWRRADDVLSFPTGRQAGDTVTTFIRYAGVPRDGLVIRDSAGARTAFADNWPNRAHRWFPSQDHPSDKATVSFQVTVPHGYQVIANGALISTRSLGPALDQWGYRTDHPIPVYTMVVGVARFARTAAGNAGCAVRCVPVAVWTYPADSAWAVGGPFRRAREIVDFFTGLVGDFPYSGLTHVQSSTIFGGMENSTAIFYDEAAYSNRRLTEGTVAHETAHQWFGDAVTEREWPHLWLSEGFATYFDGLWVEHIGGDSALQGYMRGQARGIYRDSVTEHPIVDSTGDLMDLLNSNNYNKGAWVLHSLRGLLGDSLFFKGIGAYYRAFRDSTALSEDFQKVMETAAGRDLAWYFKQALHQPGYPVVEFTSRYDSTAHRLTLRFRQVQKPAWGTYRLPGLEILVDSLLVRVDLDSPMEELTFDQFAQAPREIRVDPNAWWLLEVRTLR